MTAIENNMSLCDGGLSSDKTAAMMERITNPPEKVRLMYEAVSELVLEQADISALKVSTITSRAGIGKGTAYEYFSSKEELLAYAVTYAYSRKTLELAGIAFQPESFQDRFFAILDWLLANKEYYKLLGWSTRGVMGDALNNRRNLSIQSLQNSQWDEKCQIPSQITDYLSTKIREFMQHGYDQGCFTEMDSTKWELALISSVVEYWFVTMARDMGLYGGMTGEQLREFVYHTLISSLS